MRTHFLVKGALKYYFPQGKEKLTFGDEHSYLCILALPNPLCSGNKFILLPYGPNNQGA